MNATIPFTLTADLEPPRNIECEEAVLGACLVDNAVIDEVSIIVTAEDFYRDAHAEVWKLMLDLRTTGIGIDPNTLKEYMGRRRIGTSREIDDILQDILRSPQSENATYYAQIIKQLATLRALEAATFDIRRDIHAKTMTPDEILAAAQSRIFQIADRGIHHQTTLIGQGVLASVDRVRSRLAGVQEGTSTGYRGLDYYLGGGLIPGRLIIVAARPAMGKTCLGLNIAENISINDGLPSLLFSLEMVEEEISDRILFSRCRIAAENLRDRNKITEGNIARIDAEAIAIDGHPMAINDTSSLTIAGLMSEARRQHSRMATKVIIVDYIQLIEHDNPTNRESRQEHIAKAARGLKMLARELKVPVIAISQLNRQADNREDHRPRLSDLRESGAIEQDADQVIFIHRPCYYDPNESQYRAELIFAKNRHGPTGTIELGFLQQFTRFEEYDPQDLPTPNF